MGHSQNLRIFGYQQIFEPQLSIFSWLEGPGGAEDTRNPKFNRSVRTVVIILYLFGAVLTINPEFCAAASLKIPEDGHVEGGAAKTPLSIRFQG